PKSEHLNIVEVTKLALDIFNEDFISFYSSKEDISAQFDRTQLIRIITNLVKNAIQACADQTDPQINVHVREQAGSVLINVEDNGPGISDANKNRIFEPKFTTKSSGMGLGLGIIKNIVE